jgi:hypothetical protein
MWPGASSGTTAVLRTSKTAGEPAAPPPRQSGDYYLCAGQITPYKKIEIAVEACTRMGKPLVVIVRAPTGPAAPGSPSVEPRRSTTRPAHHFAHCKALLFPGVEDFGIVPLEVTASGGRSRFAKGGALETVVEEAPPLLQRSIGRCRNRCDGAFEAMKDSFVRTCCRRTPVPSIPRSLGLDGRTHRLAGRRSPAPWAI